MNCQVQTCVMYTYFNFEDGLCHTLLARFINIAGYAYRRVTQHCITLPCVASCQFTLIHIVFVITFIIYTSDIFYHFIYTHILEWQNMCKLLWNTHLKKLALWCSSHAIRKLTFCLRGYAKGFRFTPPIPPQNDRTVRFKIVVPLWPK